VSTVKTNNVQIGQSVTATNNFTWYQPSSPDGTVRLGNGNAGSVTDLVTVNSSGNVGIGTSSPTGISGYTALTLGGSSSKGLLTFRSSSASDSGYLYHTGSSIELAALSTTPLNLTTSNANLTLGTVGTTRVTLDQSGNLGLGVTPSYIIDAYSAANGIIRIRGGSGTNQGGAFYVNNAANTATLTALGDAARIIGGTPDTLATIYANGVPLSFYIGSERARIDSSGNLLVGKTVADDSTTGFRVAPGSCYMSMARASAAPCYFNRTGTDGAVVEIANDSVIVGTISVSGSNTAYNTTSDQRLKENIVDAPSAINSVNAIKIRSFDWKSDGSHVDYGYIAQELLEVAPEAVSVPADPEEMMGVDFGRLTPRLVKAIQELTARLEALEGAK